jgi:hypothetical protein
VPVNRVAGQKYDLDPLEPIAFPPDFDPVDYLGANPDVLEAGADPVVHYKHFGWHEGRPIRVSSTARNMSNPVGMEAE